MFTNLNEISTNPPETFRKKDAEQKTEHLKKQMFELQNVLYAEKKHSLLIILQGMDASGKDGTVKHVFSSMNPMGVDVTAFKAPTPEEMAHDFLWRIHKNVPAIGMIQIFNRSQYEDILVPIVHKTLDKDIIKRRFEIINSFERGLTESGTVIIKFYLHISKKEQMNRIEERQTIMNKKWKYDPGNSAERGNWDKYMKIYEKIFQECSKELPWIIVPADHKWYRNYVIAEVIVNTMKDLKMKYPG